MSSQVIAPHPLVVQGRQAFRKGDLTETQRLCEARLAQVANDTQALELKAVLLRRRGDLTGTEAVMSQAIQADPACGWALNGLAALLRETGQRAAAEQAAREALAVRPDDAQAHVQLGIILAEKDELPAAEYHNRRALELNGPQPQTLLNLGLTLYHQGRLDEALTALLEAHFLAPDAAVIMGHVSRVYEAKRDMAAAWTWLERAETAGRTTGEDFTLVRALYLGHSGQTEAALNLIEASGKDVTLDQARLLDRLGRYDEAWDAMVAAKAQLSQALKVSYDAPRVAARYDALMRFFTPERLRHLPAATVRQDGPQPIFILGFPRSGTTLVEQVLASHPQVGAGGELPFVYEWQALIRHILPCDAPFPQRLAFAAAADFHHVPGLLRDHYLGRAAVYGVAGTGSRLTDKMPLNDVYLPLIRMAFPAAPVVRMVRHPLDIAVSILSHHLSHGENCGYAIDTIMTHLTRTHALNRHYDTVMAPQVTTLRYEDFVADQDGETRRILAVCGLDFDAACLRFHDNPRHAPTPSYAQVSQPLHARSVGRWRAYRRHLAPWFDHIAPMVADLGYQLD